MTFLMKLLIMEHLGHMQKWRGWDGALCCAVVQPPRPPPPSLPRRHVMCASVVSRSGPVVELWGICAVTCGLTVEKASAFCPRPGILAHTHPWAGLMSDLGYFRSALPTDVLGFPGCCVL